MFFGLDIYAVLCKSIRPHPGPSPKKRGHKGETMNTQTETTVTNPMQAIEASPLEEQSLPADEVIAEQQAGFADSSDTAPIFVP
jgi:hypothetical protein